MFSQTRIEVLLVILNTLLVYSRLINVQDSNGITPLMLAVKKENIGVVKFLVSKGASVDKFDEGQDSVFHFAAATNKDIVEVRSHASVEAAT